MRIVAVSDLHGSLPDLPPADLIILSGDLTGGNPSGPRDHSEAHWLAWIAGEFSQWVRSLEASLVVAVAGNHDTVFEVANPTLPLTYLCDSGTTFRGLRIWGHPWVTPYDTLAFSLPDRDRAVKVNGIPPDTDILVCHGPPFGAGDLVDGRHVGCHFLASRIEWIAPRLVTCGHIHPAHGRYAIGASVVLNVAQHPTTLDILDSSPGQSCW